MPEIVKQQTVKSNGEKVELVGVRVDAVNEFVARQRARTYVRRKFPTTKNILTPELTEKNTKQSTFNDIIPERIEVEEHIIEVTMVR